jgi:hypothetical protein
MKNKPRPREYKFSRKDDKICLHWRFGFGYELEFEPNPEDSIWCFHGSISEEDVKVRLTPKQFAKFKAGDDGPFISSPIDPKKHNEIQRKRNKS